LLNAALNEFTAPEVELKKLKMITIVSIALTIPIAVSTYAMLLPKEINNYVLLAPALPVQFRAGWRVINDGPALARVDLGIAIGSGRDIAKETGGIILIKGDVRSAVIAFQLGGKNRIEDKAESFLGVCI
jgi:cation transport ATPase